MYRNVLSIVILVLLGMVCRNTIMEGVSEGYLEPYGNETHPDVDPQVNVSTPESSLDDPDSAVVFDDMMMAQMARGPFARPLVYGTLLSAVLMAAAVTFSYRRYKARMDTKKVEDDIEALTHWCDELFNDSSRTRDPHTLLDQWLKREGKKSCMYTGYEIQKYYDAYGEEIEYPWSNITDKKIAEIYHTKGRDLEKAKKHILKHRTNRYYRMGVRFFFNPLAPTQSVKYDRSVEDNTQACVRAAQKVKKIWRCKQEVFVRNLRDQRTTENKKQFVQEPDPQNPLIQRKKATVRVWGEAQSLGEARHDVSTARRQVVMDGDQRVLTSPVAIFGLFTVTPDGFKYKRMHEEWVDWSLDATCQAVSGFKPDEDALRGDFIRRKLNGLCCDEATKLRLAEGCAEVAKLEAIAKMERAALLGAASAGMSKRMAVKYANALSLPKKYLRVFATEPLKADKKKEELKVRRIEKMREEAAHAVRSSTRAVDVWSAIFVGIALTPLMVASLAPQMPALRAKRDCVIQKYKENVENRPTIKYDLMGTASPSAPVWYDRSQQGVVEASFIGRVDKDNGRATREGVVNLLKGAKFLLHSMDIGRNDTMELTHEAMHAYIDSRNWARNKKDIHHRVIDECIPDIVTVEWLRGYLECDAFIKDEHYTESASPFRSGGKAKVKPPRNICNRKMEFKIVLGTLLTPLNDDFFHHKFCIKHVSQCDRGHYLSEMFNGAGACLTTDHSAFESSANAVNQAVCEQLIYRYAVPRKYWDLVGLIMQPTWINNEKAGIRILTDTVRYSGDVITSLGNSLLNASSALAAYHALVEQLPALSAAEEAYVDEVMASYGAASGRRLTAGGDPFIHNLPTFEKMWREFTTRPAVPQVTDLTFIVEGDDACVASPRLPEASVYQAEMRKMGLNVTIEGAGDISKAGFCKVFWNEIAGRNVTYCDIEGQILTCRWSTHPPVKKMSKLSLLKSKLMSLCQQFPGCPVVWKLCEGVKQMAVEDNAYERSCLDAQKAAYWTKGGYLFTHVTAAVEPTPEQRHLFSELYGITPCAQVELEKDPVHGMDRLLSVLQSTSESDMYKEIAQDTVAWMKRSGPHNYVYKF